MDAVLQTLGGLTGIHGLLQSMWKHFMQMIEIFMRRFGATFHQLRLTYQKLFTSLSRTWSIAMAGVWQGFSTVYATMSFIDLIIKICIAILIILVIMVLILWLFLWPIVPALIIIIAIITMAGFGAAVGGMGASLCFGPSAQVEMSDGSHKPIVTVQVGDVLKDGNRVTATMKMKNGGDFFLLKGIPVSGSHIVYDPTPMFVRDHPDAAPYNEESEHIYCLNTEQHTIPIVSPTTNTTYLFADWEEIGDESLVEWNRIVFEQLNPGCNVPCTLFMEEQLESDPLVSPDCQVQTPHGAIPVSACNPGMFVLDSSGNPTEVLGVVHATKDSVKAEMGGISAGCWIHSSGIWFHPIGTQPPCSETWMSLITASGTYKIVSTKGHEIHVRDFTDVGITNIHSLAGWTLSSLFPFQKHFKQDC
jgi:hypothetical protein